MYNILALAFKFRQIFMKILRKMISYDVINKKLPRIFMNNFLRGIFVENSNEFQIKKSYAISIANASSLDTRI